MFMPRGKRKNKGGARYTFISIVMIIIVIYVFKLVSPHGEVTYPDIIQYAGVRYVYTGTAKSIPFMFVRKKPVTEEGYIVLARRGVDVSEAVYIYEGYMRYRRYAVLKE